MTPGLALSIALFCLTLNGQTARQQPAPAVEHSAALSEADLPAFLARVQANFTSNGKIAQQYTSDELWRNRSFDKNGKPTVDHSAKYENVFVEGMPYRKKVEENGKALSGKEALAEEKRYNQAVRERRAMTIGQKRMSMHFTWNSSLPMCCLATLFSNHIVGYDRIEGRDVVIIESMPRSDAKPSNDEETSALGWKQKSWIDLSDAIFARIEVESLADISHFVKGTTLRLDFDRIGETPMDGAHPEQAVWLLRRTIGQVRFKLLWMGGSGTTEQTWSNYKKFHVDMHLLEDTVTPVSENSVNSTAPDHAHP